MLQLNDLTAHQANTAYSYYKLVLKVEKTKANIYYNKKCREHNLKPKYIKVSTRSKSTSAKKTIKHAEKYWLSMEINHLFIKLKSTIAQLQEVQRNLNDTTLFNTDLKEKIINTTRDKVKIIVDKKRENGKKKIFKLISEQHKSFKGWAHKHKFAPRFVNLTKLKLTSDETNLLENAHKLNMHQKISNVNLLLNTEKSISSIDPQDQQKVRGMFLNDCDKILTKNDHVNNTLKHDKTGKSLNTCINKLSQKIVDNNLELVDVDKSNAIVLIESKEIDKKVDEFITSNNIAEIGKDPTKEYAKTINNLIDKSKHILNPNSKKYLKYTIPTTKTNNINVAKPPKFRPIIKLHKNGKPIRPLVNTISSPSYKLAKHLDSTIKNILNLENKYNVKNSTDFRIRIELHKFKMNRGYKIFSLDIVNLYANIPIDEAIQILERKLKESDKISDHECKELVHMIRIILDQNYFTYKGRLFKAENGVAMGGPLSYTIAQIFLNELEENHIMNEKNPFFKSIKKYFRYVDDTFFIFVGTDRMIDQFVKYLNSVSNHIKFTVEKMTNNTINYLDLTIYIDNDGYIRYKIYRKPTATNSIIPNNSNSPNNHKHAALHAMAHRAFSIPLSYKNRQQEIAIIQEIARANGYPRYIVNKILKKHKNNAFQERQQENHTTKDKRFVSLNYYGPMSRNIGKYFENANYTPAFSTSNNVLDKIKKSVNKIKKAHSNHHDVSNDKNIAGVYQIECNTCDKKYIGKTERSIACRFKEHINVKSSNVYRHIKEENHIINDSNVKILHKCSDKKLLSVLEKFEIVKAVKSNSNLLNVQTEIDLATNQLYERCAELCASS